MEGAFKRPHLYAGAGVLLVIGWAFASTGGAILHGHPTYWVAYGFAFAAAVGAIAASFAWRHRALRPGWSVAGTSILLLLAGLSWWLQPYEATDIALGAMRSDDAVLIDSGLTEITMTPTRDRSDVGVIFLPGAKVDARAYANILRPLADAGHVVVIVKEPLGIAFLAAGAAPSWAAAHPDTAVWVVAGHSLGGVVAAQNASEPNDLADLILWASFPATDVSAQPFAAVSVFGTRDSLTSLDQIDDSRSDLPPGTAFVAVEGAIHSHFGDYGDQPGDGETATPRRIAQTEIISATLRFLDR